MHRALAGRALVVAAVVSFTPASVAGQSAAEQEKAFKVIADIVTRTCQRPGPAQGTRTTVGGNAGVNVGLPGVTKAVIDLGGEVGARAEKVQWSGVAQETFAMAMASGNDCVVRMYELILPVLLSPRSTPPGANKLPYAMRKDGEVLWFGGLHNTVETCLRSVEELKTSASECRRLPERLVCSYLGIANASPRPQCHWTSKECEVAYVGQAARLASVRAARQAYVDAAATAEYNALIARGRRALGPSPRFVPPIPTAPCEDVAWPEAEKQHQAFVAATVSAR